jgi:hypothetical protein
MTGQPPRAVVVTVAVLRASGRSRGPLLTVLAPIEPWTIRGSHVEGCWHLPVCVPLMYPRTYSTDVDDLWLLAEWHEVKL